MFVFTLTSITHFLGVILSVVGFYCLLLLLLSRDLRQKLNSFSAFLGCVIFGVSLLVLYICSTLYHSTGFMFTESRDFFQRLDHVAIYILIAGTYTPLVLLIMIHRGQYKKLGNTVLVLIWMAALCGSSLKILVSPQDLPEWLSVGFYLLMGWGSMVAVKPIVKVTPFVILKWIAFGGFFYSSGVVFLLWDSLVFNHSVWHLFVLGGSACHYAAVILTLTEKQSLKDAYDLLTLVMKGQKTLRLD